MGNGQSSSRVEQHQDIPPIQHSDIAGHAAPSGREAPLVAEPPGPSTTVQADPSQSGPSPSDAQPALYRGLVGPMRRRPAMMSERAAAGQANTRPWWTAGHMAQDDPGLTTTHSARAAWASDKGQLPVTASAALRAVHRVSYPPMYPDIPELPEESSDHGSIAGNLNESGSIRPLPSPLAEALRKGLGRSPVSQKSGLPVSESGRASMDSGQQAQTPVYRAASAQTEDTTRRPDQETRDGQGFGAEGGHYPGGAAHESAGLTAQHVRVASGDPHSMTPQERLAHGWTTHVEDRRGQTPPPGEETPTTPDSIIIDPYRSEGSPSSPLRSPLAPYGDQTKAARRPEELETLTAPILNAGNSSGANEISDAADLSVPLLMGGVLESSRILHKMPSTGILTPVRLTQSEDPTYLSSSAGSSRISERHSPARSSDDRRQDPLYVTQLDGIGSPPHSPETSISLQRDVASPQVKPSGMVAAAGLTDRESTEVPIRFSSAEQPRDHSTSRIEVEELWAGPTRKRNTLLIQDLFRPSRLSQRLDPLEKDARQLRQGSLLDRLKSRVRQGSETVRNSAAKSVIFSQNPPGRDIDAAEQSYSSRRLAKWPPFPQAPKKPAAQARTRQMSAPPAMGSTTTFPRANGQEDASMLGGSEEFTTETSHSHLPMVSVLTLRRGQKPRHVSEASEANAADRGDRNKQPVREFPVRSLRRHSSRSGSNRSLRSGRSHASSAASLRNRYRAHGGLHDSPERSHGRVGLEPSSRVQLTVRNPDWEDIAEEPKMPKPHEVPADLTPEGQGSKFRIRRKMVPLGSYFNWPKRPAHRPHELKVEVAEVARPRAVSEPAQAMSSEVAMAQCLDPVTLTTPIMTQTATPDHRLLSTPMVCASSNSSFSSLAPPPAPQPVPPKRPRRRRRDKKDPEPPTITETGIGLADEPLSACTAPRDSNFVAKSACLVPPWDDPQAIAVETVSPTQGTLTTIWSAPQHGEEDLQSRKKASVTQKPSRPAFETQQAVGHRPSPRSATGPTALPAHLPFALTPALSRTLLRTEEKDASRTKTDTSSRDSVVRESTSFRRYAVSAGARSSGDVARQRSGGDSASWEALRGAQSDSRRPSTASAGHKRSGSWHASNEAPAFASGRSVSLGHHKSHKKEESTGSFTKHAGEDELSQRVQQASQPGPNVSLTSAMGQLSSSAALTQTDSGPEAGEVNTKLASGAAISDRLNTILEDSKQRREVEEKATSDDASLPLSTQRKPIDGLPVTDDLDLHTWQSNPIRQSWTSADGPWLARVVAAKATPPAKGYADPHLSTPPPRPPGAIEPRDAPAGRNLPIQETGRGGLSEEGLSVPRGGVQASLAALNAIENELHDRELDRPTASRFLGSSRYMIPESSFIDRRTRDTSDGADKVFSGSRLRRKAAPYAREPTRYRREDSYGRPTGFSSGSDSHTWTHRKDRARPRARIPAVRSPSDMAVVSSTGLESDTISASWTAGSTNEFRRENVVLPSTTIRKRVPDFFLASTTPRLARPDHRQMRSRQARVEELIAAWDELASSDWRHYITPPRRVSSRSQALMRALSEQSTETAISGHGPIPQSFFTAKPTQSTGHHRSRTHEDTPQVLRGQAQVRLQASGPRRAQRRLEPITQYNSTVSDSTEEEEEEQEEDRRIPTRSTPRLPVRSSEMHSVPFPSMRASKEARRHLQGRYEGSGAEDVVIRPRRNEKNSLNRRHNDDRRGHQRDGDTLDDADEFGVYRAGRRRPEAAGLWKTHHNKRSYLEERQMLRERYHSTKARRSRRQPSTSSSQLSASEDGEYTMERHPKPRKGKTRSSWIEPQHLAGHLKPPARPTEPQRSEQPGQVTPPHRARRLTTGSRRRQSKQGYERSDILAWQHALDMTTQTGPKPPS
ncbi:unnamed protein product [Parajaminaea phylloscopi]